MKWLMGLALLIGAGVLAITSLDRLDVMESQTAVRVTGIYSDLMYSEQSGDLRGTEIMVVASSEGLHALIQSSEGPLGCPVVVPAVANELTIEFTLPYEPCMFGVPAGGHFVGEVSAEGLRGYFEGYEGFVLELPRGVSFWRYRPEAGSQNEGARPGTHLSGLAVFESSVAEVREGLS
jgi:hypothetical protein